MTEWRPIATAPKDGTEIILTDGDTVGAGFWDDAPIAKRAEAGWFWEMDRGDLLTAKNAYCVVAWMPLPKPPSEGRMTHDDAIAARGLPWIAHTPPEPPQDALQAVSGAERGGDTPGTQNGLGGAVNRAEGDKG